MKTVTVIIRQYRDIKHWSTKTRDILLKDATREQILAKLKEIEIPGFPVSVDVCEDTANWFTV